MINDSVKGTKVTELFNKKGIKMNILSKTAINSLDLVEAVVEEQGWDIKRDDSLFRKSLFFTPTRMHVKPRGEATVFIPGILNIEFVTWINPVSPLKTTELHRLLNLVNQTMILGSLTIVEEDSEEYAYFVHRSQLCFDDDIGMTKTQVEKHLIGCTTSLELCLPHIFEFLSIKPQGILDTHTGKITSVILRMSAEECFHAILHEAHGTA